jgi:osmotically-inducible protein OsmY
MVALDITSITTDDCIRDAVLAEFRCDPNIGVIDIGVIVRDAVVALMGYVSSDTERDATEKATKRVFGVRAVANNLLVKLPNTRTDTEIGRGVVRELDNRIGASSDSITATVKNGWVTLEGLVDSQQQKSMAESAVNDVQGVVSVTNRLEARPMILPTEVRDKIEATLLRIAELTAGAMSVEVHASTVKLRGTVHSQTEKYAVRQAIWSIPGVTRVDASLSVDDYS